MGIIDQGKMLWKAREVQKQLKNTEIEAKSSDGLVSVVFNAEMHVKKIMLADDALNVDKRTLEQDLEKTIAEALSRAQAVAAEKTKDMMKDMNINLPGM